ncbi:MAG: biotin/lipoyl-containing protein, partial [Deltaproteobacteria bacterium]|nr:biotin/lipoyl-containing protein [Deltaproteobacteria bacterium]
YDPLLAKLIAHAPTRGAAIDRLAAALRDLAVGGVTTNRDFLLAVLAHPEFRAGAIDTHFIDRHLPLASRQPARDAATDRLHAVAAALDAHERRRAAGDSPLPASIPSGWRNARWRPQDVSYRLGGEHIEVRYVAESGRRFLVECGGATSSAWIAGWTPAAIDFELDGVRRRCRVAVAGDTVYVHSPRGDAALVELPRFPSPWSDDMASGCLAPMPGIVRQVLVKPGDAVEKGTVMVVLEAMKMEHPLVANVAATVTEVRVEVGQMVDPDAIMVVLETAEA